MARFAFAFYVYSWRAELARLLRILLHSLDTRGGAAAGYPRYLVFSGSVTAEVQAFCERHRLILQPEPALTDYRVLPNKALLCRVPPHEVVCTLDVDLIFLGDPTPLFEQAAAAGRVFSRYELILPLPGVPGVPPAWERAVRLELARRVWRAQYRRFSRDGRPVAPGPSGAGLEGLPAHPPYFNTGVNFVPGGRLRSLGDAWWHVSARLIRDSRLRRPYMRFFPVPWIEQMGYAIALHREQIPWSVLPSIYNFVPVSVAPVRDRVLARGEEIITVHVTSALRDWLDPEAEVTCLDVYRPLLERIRRIVARCPDLDR